MVSKAADFKRRRAALPPSRQDGADETELCRPRAPATIESRSATRVRLDDFKRRRRLNVNEPPEAEDDEAATNEDQAVAVAVLANDTDPDGDGLRVESVSAAGHGTARIASDGGVRYTPAPDWS